MGAPKVPNSELVQAGLELMRLAGTPLRRIEAKGRAMIYATPDGRTVRARTCNDHVLVVLAESAEKGARLNIEGTDFLLVVMPETPRSRGPVIAYLVPTEIAALAARKTHEEWLASNPNTKGKNRTWNVWFDDDGPAKANGFAHKWAQYRIHGSTGVHNSVRVTNGAPSNGQVVLGQVIADARRDIASAAGVPESAVRITIDLA